MPMLRQRDRHYAFSRPEAAGLGRGPAGEPAWARHSGHGPGPDLPIGRQASLPWRAVAYEPVTRTAMDCRAKTVTLLPLTSTLSGPVLVPPVLMAVPATATG